MENRKPEKKKLLTGDTLPYLGDTLTLTVVREDRKSGRIKRVMNRLIMTVPYEADVSFRARLLDKWFRKEALAVLTERKSTQSFMAFLLQKSISRIRKAAGEAAARRETLILTGVSC